MSVNIKTIRKIIASFWKKYEHWLALLAAALGGWYFLVRSKVYAHDQASVLDEGAYLIKGWLFATGEFKPFQDFGPWTNHMPLSYLIPGYIQVWFGSGLRVARYSAVAMAFIGLAALWLTTRRLAGKWWAALVVWLVATNPVLLKLYSVSTSQGIVFFILALCLALLLGKDRHRYQVVLAGILAGLLLLTRINLSPVYFLVLLYIFWQNGKQDGLWAAGISLAVVGGAHIFYAPGIFEFWGHWLPNPVTDAIVNLLNINPPLIPSKIAARVWDPGPSINPSSKINSMILAVRSHLFEVLGVLWAGILWRRRRFWSADHKFKAAAFLMAIFVVLFAAHAYAALGMSYCVFCLETYLGFFSPIGLLLLAILLSDTPGQQPVALWRQGLLGASILALAAWYGKADTWLISRQMLKSQIPRFSGLTPIPGEIELWGILENYFGWNFETSEKVLTGLFGFLAICAVLLLAFLSRRVFKASIKLIYPVSVSILVSGLILGTYATQSSRLSGYRRSYDCKGDIIQSHEKAGRYLAKTLEPGSQVYWEGGVSTVPMLYVPDVNLYLPQLNGDYSRFIGGDTEALLRIGRWNEELTGQWLEEADYVLAAEERYDLRITLEDLNYKLIGTTPRVIDCRQNGVIYIYENNNR
ncbi:hypothetical protein ACFLYP_02885 [Chloroflexota bacterium]